MSQILKKGKTKASAADEEVRWLRPKAAQKYYSMGFKSIDKIALECDAKKKVGDKIVLYNVQKIDRYLMTL